jgi:hypothetical protein
MVGFYAADQECLVRIIAKNILGSHHLVWSVKLELMRLPSAGSSILFVVRPLA